MPADRGADGLAEALGLIADTVTTVLADEESILSVESRERLAALARNLKGAAASLASQGRRDDGEDDEDTEGLDHLRVGSHVQTTLTRAGVDKVDQLRAMTDAELLAIRGVGPATLPAIRWAVEDHAMRWWEQPLTRVARRSDDPLPRWWERD
jgi:DNA-directed RNA polymerase alpha subunit